MAIPGEYFPPGYGKFVMRWDNADSNFDAVCVVAFRNTPDLSAVDANAALQPCWYNAARPSHVSLMSDQWTNVSTYCLVQKVGYQLSDLDDLGTVGTETDPSPSAANSLVVRKVTQFAGRRGRGRMAFPPMIVAESAVDAGGRIASGFLPGLQTVFTNALNAMTSASLPMVLLHTRKTVDEAPIPTLVQQLDVQNLMGIQRKRQRR